jgi:hypothetical protein
MKRALFSTLLAIATSSIGYVACDDDSGTIKEPASSVKPDAAGSDSSVSDAGGDGAAKDCFENPKTHFEIINACTTATKITKNPTLPKLLPDGGLPPLQ